MVDFRSLIPWRERVAAPAARDENFFDPLLAFRREMDRMFDAFFDGAGPRPVAAASWPSLAPAVDVSETDKDVVVAVELPGVDEKDIDVTLSGDLLTIKGEKKEEHEQKNGGYSYMERRYGSFTRSIRLPFEAADENVDARYDKGVLTIRVPKPAEVQKAVRRIEVKAA